MRAVEVVAQFMGVPGVHGLIGMREGDPRWESAAWNPASWGEMCVKDIRVPLSPRLISVHSPLGRVLFRDGIAFCVRPLQNDKAVLELRPSRRKSTLLLGVTRSCGCPL